MNFLTVRNTKVERLMCEVEFWEVFPNKVQWFFDSGAIDPLAGCRIADLVGIYFRSVYYFGLSA